MAATMEPTMIDLAVAEGAIAVQVQATAPSANAQKKVELQAISAEAIAELRQNLNEASQVMSKLGKSVAPWTVFKNKRRAKRSVEALESQKQALATLLSNTYDELRQNRQATSTAISEADAAKSHEAGLRDMIAQQEAAIEKLRAQVSELKEHNAVQKAQQETLLTKVEEVAPGPKRYLKMDEKREAEVLQARVEALLGEHEKLRAENEKLAKAKADMAKKVKELGDKVRDETEVREREVRRLGGELKKATEARDEAVAAAKAEVSEQLASRAKQVAALQKRLDAAKGEGETLKERENALKAQLEEVVAAAGKAGEEAKAAGRKAADVRAARDEAVRDAEYARQEAAAIAAEYKAAIKAMASSTATWGSVHKLPGMQSLIASPSTAPWPRHAFTVRGGCVLHSHACSPAIDVSRVQPREYSCVKELEGWMIDEGLVLCTACRAAGF